VYSSTTTLPWGSLASFCVRAEDGIRDRNVTGVQTCALPISEDEEVYQDSNLAEITKMSKKDRNKVIEQMEKEMREAAKVLNFERSEERRVGKECRSRWARYHRK